MSEQKQYLKSSRIRALEELIKGLNKFMGENDFTIKSELLLAKMEDRLKEAKLLPDNSVSENPVRDFTQSIQASDIIF